MAVSNKTQVKRQGSMVAPGASSMEKRSRPQSRRRTSVRRLLKGSRVGEDLVAAIEEMAQHLRGEIELPAHEVRSGAMTPAQIRSIRLKVASSTKEFERLFGIPARTMEAYEQGRRNLDGAMRALLRIIDREPKAALKALAA